jgi:hypothetical protein
MSSKKGKSQVALAQRSQCEDAESDNGDAVSVISESFQAAEGGNQVRDRNYVSGYLLKKHLDGSWQKRFFETNGPFLTYYKSKKRTKLLAALNINDVFRIIMVQYLQCNDDIE